MKFQTFLKKVVEISDKIDKELFASFHQEFPWDFLFCFYRDFIEISCLVQDFLKHILPEGYLVILK